MNTWPSLSQMVSVSSYQFNPHAIPVITAAVLVLMLGIRIIVLKQETLHRRFLGACVSIFFWLMGTAMGYLSVDASIAECWFRLDWISVCFISACVYGFTESMLGKPVSRASLIGYGLGAVFAIATLVSNPMMAGVKQHSWGFYPMRSAHWNTAFMLYFFSYMALAFSEYLRAYRATPDPIRKSQIKYIFAAFLVAYVGAIDFLPTFGINIYPFGFIFIAAFIAISAYAIVSYGLMDVRGLVRKTVVYSIISATLLAGYVGFVLLIARLTEGYFSRPSLLVSTLAAGIVAMLFHPLQVRLQQWLDRRFPRESLNQTLLREATGTFVHEIKKPLTHITLPAQLALADLEQLRAGGPGAEKSADQLEKRLRYIAEKSIEAGKMIEAIRDLASTAPLPAQTCSLRNVMESVLDPEREGLERDQVCVTLDMAPALEISGYEPQLRIVFANLIKNAAESMINQPAGRRRELRLSAHQAGDRIQVEISDTGAGISRSDQAHLFDPWFTTKGSRGMGIGLYLTREILRRHQASIEVDSHEGHGALFRISFSVEENTSV